MYPRLNSISPAEPSDRNSAIRPAESCIRLTHEELERRDGADGTGIVGQAWYPNPIAH